MFSELGERLSSVVPSYAGQFIEFGESDQDHANYDARCQEKSPHAGGFRFWPGCRGAQVSQAGHPDYGCRSDLSASCCGEHDCMFAVLTMARNDS